MPVNRTIVTTFQALEKLKKYCAYSDRSQHDVRLKLRSWQIDELSAESIIATLIEERFLSDERYANNFASGKLRINHWGKVKIKYALRQHQISERCIDNALKLIDMEEYFQIAQKTARQKFSEASGTPAERRLKTLQFLFGRGFESELGNEVLNSIVNE